MINYITKIELHTELSVCNLHKDNSVCKLSTLHLHTNYFLYVIRRNYQFTYEFWVLHTDFFSYVKCIFFVVIVLLTVQMQFNFFQSFITYILLEYVMCLQIYVPGNMCAWKYVCLEICVPGNICRFFGSIDSCYI